MKKLVGDIGYGKEFAEWYDRIFPPQAGALRTTQALAKNHPDVSTGTMEIGVGTGRIALPMSRLVGPVDGIDSSSEMLKILREATVEGEEVNAFQENICAYTTDKTYGLVYAVCATLNQITDPQDQQSAVLRAGDLLAPGGKLVIECHNRSMVSALHGDSSRTTFFTPYPEPGTGLLTCSVLSADHRLWQCSQIWHESDGSTRVGVERSLLLTPSEIHAYAQEAGMIRACPPEGFGDWELSAPPTQTSPTFITIYEKPRL